MKLKWPRARDQLLQRIKQDKPDIVLLDIEMPEISGLEALQSYARTVFRQSSCQSSWSRQRTRAKTSSKHLNMGANDYLTKPVDFPVALARIATQLSHKRAQEALKESEERYALAARGANDGLWDWNLMTNAMLFLPTLEIHAGLQRK